MASILVTGASRGIGLELTKQLLDLPESQVKRVFALSRNSSSAALQALIEQHAGRAVQLFASLDDSESVRKAASELARCLDGQGLDILVNMAGTNSQDLYGLPLAKIAPEELERVLDVNVTGVHRTTAAMYPLLEAGKHKKVIYMYVFQDLLCMYNRALADGPQRSTQVGSIAIADRYKAVPQMPYKVSKAALNMLNAQYALENADKGFTFLCISPGVSNFQISTYGIYLL